MSTTTTKRRRRSRRSSSAIVAVVAVVVTAAIASSAAAAGAATPFVGAFVHVHPLRRPALSSSSSSCSSSSPFRRMIKTPHAAVSASTALFAAASTSGGGGGGKGGGGGEDEDIASTHDGGSTGGVGLMETDASKTSSEAAAAAVSFDEDAAVRAEEELKAASAAATSAAAAATTPGEGKGGGEELMYTAHEDFSISDADLVAVGGRKELDEVIENDESLRLLSSELGVRKVNAATAEAAGGIKHHDDVVRPEIPLDLVYERTLDTVEDVAVHARRVPYKWGLSSPDYVKTTDAGGVDDRETVVVLGSGWAAHAFMKVADVSKLRIVVISPLNHFVFTPMLASAAVGTVEYRSMTEAVRSANPLIHNYIEGKAIDVDVKNKIVSVRLNPLLECIGEDDEEDGGGGGGRGGGNRKPAADDETCDAPLFIDVPYDRLVVSVGAKVADAGVPGALSHTLRLKSCDDARNVRTALGECFEYASRPDVDPDLDIPDADTERRRRVTFLIVGGGPTGVELAGELYDFAMDVTKPRVGAFSRLRDDVRVIVAHGGGEVLPQFDATLRQEAGDALRRRGIDLRLNTYVTNVNEDDVTLSTKVIDPTTGEPTGERIEEVLPVGLTVWCAGTAPVPFVSKLLDQLPDEARCAEGRIKVDRWLRPPSPPPSGDGDDGDAVLGSVFVLGDAAHFAHDDDGTEKGGEGDVSYDDASVPLPQTAQVAGQQGAYVARLLSRGYDLSAEVPTLPPPPPTTIKRGGIGGGGATSAAVAANANADATEIDIAESTTGENESVMHRWLRLRGLEEAPGFRFFNLGLLAYLGGGEALSQVQMGDVHVFKWAGSVGYVLWRSVYLVKQVATKNRVLVTFDWFKTRVFGRDVTRL